MPTTQIRKQLTRLYYERTVSLVVGQRTFHELSEHALRDLTRRGGKYRSVPRSHRAEIAILLQGELSKALKQKRATKRVTNRMNKSTVAPWPVQESSPLNKFLSFYETEWKAGNLKEVPSEEAISRLESDLEQLRAGLAAIKAHSPAKEQSSIGSPRMGS